MKTSIYLALALVACLAMSMTTLAQPLSISWYKVSGGGGASTGSVYAVSGTIGQPDAGGAMTGGNYSLTGGFWSLISVVQTAGAPTLYISHSGNTVTVYWQNVANWTLQQNANLAVLTAWGNSSGISQSNGTNSVTLTNPTGNQFYRLYYTGP